MTSPSAHLKAALSSETAYQLVMVAAMLELLLLGALMPRTPDGGAPIGFAAVSGLRLMTLLALAAVLATQRNTVKPISATIALCIWGAMLAPPELWAAATELRNGLPVTMISSIALSGGFYAALRLHRAIGWGFLALIFSALYMQDWKSEPLGSALIAVIALGAALWLIAFNTEHGKSSRLESGSPQSSSSQSSSSQPSETVQ